MKWGGDCIPALRADLKRPHVFLFTPSTSVISKRRSCLACPLMVAGMRGKWGPICKWAFEKMRMKTQKSFQDIRYKYKSKIKKQKIMLKNKQSIHDTSAFWKNFRIYMSVLWKINWKSDSFLELFKVRRSIFSFCDQYSEYSLKIRHHTSYSTNISPLPLFLH